MIGSTGLPNLALEKHNHPTDHRWEIPVTDPLFSGRSFFHGTKANLKHGDLIKPGVQLQLWEKGDGRLRVSGRHLECGDLGAELAFGQQPGRIYVVDATGPIEDDPNLTDKKYPGNPTLSYRSRDPLRVIGEVIDWQGHSADELNNMAANVERSRQRGVEAIED
jgi:hypothetical protein